MQMMIKIKEAMMMVMSVWWGGRIKTFWIHSSSAQIKKNFSVDKKNQLDVTFVFFISLLLVAQHVSLAGSASMDALPANRSWQPSCNHGTYQHEAITSRSRQLLMMGTWLPETCWATSRSEIKNTKVTSSWFFLSTPNYDAQSTTHQIKKKTYLEP